MTSLAEHHSSEFVKMMYIGDSSTGKTGSLTSLVCQGYKLRVLDLDNGLDVLKHHVAHECPKKLASVDYETRRDKYKSTKSGPIVSGVPKAYTDALDLMMKWSDETDPAEWGNDYIFVVDTFDSLGKAAYEWAKNMNPTAKDPRNWYFTAQQSLENVLQLLTGAEFKCNVIVISHVNLKETATGIWKGHASAIGSALGPIIPKYFNTLVLAESSGQGKNVRRMIKTLPTGIVDVKTPVSFKIDAELPLETGLATLFDTLKETP